MSNVKRFGSFARDDTLPLIEEFATKYGVSRAALTEVLVAGLTKGQLNTDVELQAIVDAGKDWIKTHRIDGRKKRGEMLAALNKLPQEQLEKILKEQVGT